MTSKKAQSKTEVPAKFVDCRAFRHQTRHVHDTATYGVDNHVIEFTRQTTCINCGVMVFTTYSLPDFLVSKRRYVYPDNYRVTGGYPVREARQDYIANHISKIQAVRPTSDESKKKGKSK